MSLIGKWNIQLAQLKITKFLGKYSHITLRICHKHMNDGKVTVMNVGNSVGSKLISIFPKIITQDKLKKKVGKVLLRKMIAPKD